MKRIKVRIQGAVQGVGFRPFVYRLAKQLHLNGWIENSSQGVTIDVEGIPASVGEFLARLRGEKPARSYISSLECSDLDPVGHTDFTIRHSDQSGAKSAFILPDLATCSDCLSEIFDQSNRRYLYPFTNCTNCGPRFSIIRSLPYDRPNTSMREFQMCEQCRREYADPEDRRFHAQPNACSKCGPHLELWDAKGSVLCGPEEAITAAVAMLREGRIIAMKGLGGFQLLVDASNEDAVLRLRQRKQREEKPFAVLFPSLQECEKICEIGEQETHSLTSPECPIVLLRKNSFTSLSEAVAPRNPYIGAMLPYSPLHHILTAQLQFPVVATSGNISEEPICIDENEALESLGNIADFYLVHNRPIVRHVDDSIVRVVLNRELVLRRARGYAPLPVSLQQDGPSLLAVGGHLKNAVSLSIGRNAFVSQHIGDLESHKSFAAFQKVVRDLQKLYDVAPVEVVCDLHPEYLSTKYASTLGIPQLFVQHHQAHVASCMADNELDGEVLGVAWDGTGYGTDGTIWGGEFFITRQTGFHRFATFRNFPLPGNDAAIREPRRTALGLLYELFSGNPDLSYIEQFVTASEIRLLLKMLDNRINTARTSSAGRLFDAVASLCGIRQKVSYEGQAAMELEFHAQNCDTNDAYPVEIKEKELLFLDWELAITALLTDIKRGTSRETIAAKFHNAMAEAIVKMATAAGVERIVLTGGCFQNRILTERTVARLRDQGFKPYWHQRIPPNDGGICVGQIYAAMRMRLQSSLHSEADEYTKARQRTALMKGENICV